MEYDTPPHGCRETYKSGLSLYDLTELILLLVILALFEYMMASDKPTTQTIEMTSADDAIRALGAADPVVDGDIEEDLKQPEPLPKAEDQLDALGIPNWRDLEKQVVRRLDLTLMPCLWCLYLFNYLDRASIGQARISTLQEDINLTDSQFSTAVSILSYG